MMTASYLTSLASRLVALAPPIPNWFAIEPRGHQPTPFDELVIREFNSLPVESQSNGSQLYSHRWTVRWPSYLLYNHSFVKLSPWVMIETHRTREFSTFMLFLKGRYICDTIQPSLHRDARRWDIGGRGGLPSGIYRLWPYSWKDKHGLPVWELVGDARRGAILIHSGNTVKDSKGCILCGLLNPQCRLINSRLSTAVVWSLLNQKERYNVTDLHPGFTILRSGVYYG